MYIYVLVLQLGTNILTPDIASEGGYSKRYIFGLYDIINFNRVYITFFKLSPVLLITTVIIHVCIEMTNLN